MNHPLHSRATADLAVPSARCDAFGERAKRAHALHTAIEPRVEIAVTPPSPQRVELVAVVASRVGGAW